MPDDPQMRHGLRPGLQHGHGTIGRAIIDNDDFKRRMVGQRAVNAFDKAINVSGLVITKLEGSAIGGVLAAIALWAAQKKSDSGVSLGVYFIGIGEKLEDLQPFDAEAFAQALIT